MSDVENKLEKLGVKIPEMAVPVASYVPYVDADGFVFVSGQLPVVSGELIAKGKVGDSLGMDEARKAARACAVNAIAAIKNAAGGDLDKVEKIIKLEGYVASDPSFTDQHLVVNEASELIAEAFGTAGKHSRIAVGVVSLPMDAPVELSVVFKLLK